MVRVRYIMTATLPAALAHNWRICAIQLHLRLMQPNPRSQAMESAEISMKDVAHASIANIVISASNVSKPIQPIRAIRLKPRPQQRWVLKRLGGWYPYLLQDGMQRLWRKIDYCEVELYLR